MYGAFEETKDFKIRCEMCGKWIESKKRIEIYGPDVVIWGNEQRKRPHWFDSQVCADEYNRRNK